jgi:GAF domain-containing protein
VSVVGVDDRLIRVATLVAQHPARPDAPDGIVGVLQRLCGAAAGALGASGVGVNVMAENGERGVNTASDPASEKLDDLQFALGEGPCIDAFAARRPVLVPNLSDGATNRWPIYASAAYDRGVRAAFAFPLQVGAGRLGVLDVFRARPGRLTTDELGQAVTFAEVAMMILLDRQENAAPHRLAHGLDDAIGARAELFQAQGMVMVQLGVSLGEALARIRAYAYVEDRPLAEVARDIVARRLRFDRDQP